MFWEKFFYAHLIYSEAVFGSVQRLFGAVVSLDHGVICYGFVGNLIVALIALAVVGHKHCVFRGISSAIFPLA